MSWEDALAFNMRPPQLFTPLQAPTITQPRIIRPPLAQPPPPLGGYGNVPTGGGGTTPPKGPAGPPEKFTFALPVSTRAPGEEEEVFRPASETQSDPFGGAVGDFTRTNNLGSIFGSVYEAPFGAAIEASRFSGVPIVGALGPQVTAGFADAVFGTLTTIAEGINNAANFVKDSIRDQEVKSRAINYAKLVTSTATQFELITYDDPLEKMKKIVAALTGTSYEQQRAITMAAWDLPEDVKAMLDRNPLIAFDDKKLTKLLDDSESGRKWTYTDSPFAAALNMGPDLGIDILLLYATGGVAGAVKAVGLPAAQVGGAAGRLAIQGELGFGRAHYLGGILSRGAQAAARVPGLPTVARAATRGTSAAMQVNKAWTRLGMGTMGVTYLLDGIARTVGNEEALEFANNVWNYHPFSENPAVMYVTSFTVNPFSALNSARRGVVKVYNGSSILVGKATGNRIAEVWSTEDRLERMFAKVYGYDLASVPEAIDRHFGGRRGVLMDHMVNLAAQDVLDRVPEEIAVIYQQGYKDIARQEQILREFGPQIMDVLEQADSLERVRLTVQNTWHNYRGSLEVYDPDQALINMYDYAQSKLNTFDLRQNNNVVLGYPAWLVPRATDELRQVLAAVEGDAIPAAILDEFGRSYNGWVKYSPRLKPSVTGNAGSRMVPRDEVEKIIQLAEEDYRLSQIKRPVTVRTGKDPILRPDAPMREWAEAFGTDQATIRIARNPTADIAAEAEVLRPFVMAKREVLPEGPFSELQVAAMTDGEIHARAIEFVEEMSQPWVKMGKAVDAAETHAAALRSRAAQASAAHDLPESERLLKEAAKVEETIREAGGPLTPYSATVTGAIREAGVVATDYSMMSAARRMVDARARLHEIDDLKDSLRSTFDDVEKSLSHVHRNGEGAWVYDSSSPVPASLLRKLLRFLKNTDDNRITSLTERNRSEIWKLVRKYALETTDRSGKRMKLNAAEDRALREVKIGSDEIGDALRMGVAANVHPSEALADLIGTKLAIDELLVGKSETLLRRSADNASIPKPFEEAAINEYAFRKNYIAEVEVIPERVKQIREALSTPEDPVAYGEAARIIGESELLSNELYHLAKGRDFEDWLRDPDNAGAILAALPEGTVKLTPLDEALVAAVSSRNPGRIAEALDDIARDAQTRGEDGLMVTLTRPKAPIENVTFEQAEDIAAGKQPRPAGADGGAGTDPAYLAARKAVEDLEGQLAAQLRREGAPPDLDSLLAQAKAEVAEFRRRLDVVENFGRLKPEEAYDAAAHAAAEARLASFTAAKGTGRLSDTIRQQWIDTGRVGPDEVAAVAAVIEQRAARLGMSPDDFWKSRNVRVEATEMPADLDIVDYQDLRTLIEKLEAMAGQTTQSPNEAAIAARKLAELRARMRAEGVPEPGTTYRPPPPPPAPDPATWRPHTNEPPGGFRSDTGSPHEWWTPPRSRTGAGDYRSEYPPPGREAPPWEPRGRPMPPDEPPPPRRPSEAAGERPVDWDEEHAGAAQREPSPWEEEERAAPGFFDFLRRRARRRAEEPPPVEGWDFQTGEGAGEPIVRGFTVKEVNDTLIGLTKMADATTALHEVWHGILEPSLMAIEKETLRRLDALGERGAQLWEKYIHTGQTGIAELDSVFAKLKAMFEQVYAAIKGSPLDAKLTPEIKTAFDDLFGRPAAPAAPATATTKAWNAAIRRAKAGVAVVHPITGDLMPGDANTLAQLRAGRKLNTTTRAQGAAPKAPKSPEVLELERQIRQAKRIVSAREAMPAAKEAARQRRAPYKRGRSRELEDNLHKSGVELTELPSRELLAGDKIGAEVLSIIGWGIPGRLPSTLSDVITILREIERGRAANIGLGPASLARAQKLAEAILDRHLNQGRGRIYEGLKGHGGVRPEKWSADDQEIALKLMEDGVVDYGPMGLQYAFKKLPRGEIQLEPEEARRIADEYGIPTLAEELFRRHFQPYQTRLFETQAKNAFNFVFGPQSLLHFVSPGKTTNLSMYQAAKIEFTTRAVRQGASADDANMIWNALSDYASSTNIARKIKDAITGEVSTVQGQTTLMMTPSNIPGGNIQRVARQSLEKSYGGVPAHLRTIDWDNTFREATSPVMRRLADMPGPLGAKLEGIYGATRFNWFATTVYYIFRFAADFRYHAQNFLEGAFLYAGRSALRPGELDRGLMGMTLERFQRMGENVYANTGLTFARDRTGWAERSFRKEQPDALRNEVREIKKQDPDTIHRALEELGRTDPELSKTIAAFGDTPHGWMVATDKWYDRIMNSVDIDGEFNEEFARLAAAEPAMAEIYGRLNKVNLDLWADVKQTFMGNPNRSQLERTLNSWLLYWPLSYQIKSAKWLLRVMFDRMGGLPTNGYGAYSLDQLRAEHNRMMETDPEYSQWIADHQTLIFAAQSLFPLNPFDAGVSLNPMLRNLFFPETHKKVLEIGPVYTWNTFAPQIMGEIYPDLHDVPGMDFAYRTLVGRTPPDVARTGNTPVPSGSTQVPSIFAP